MAHARRSRIPLWPILGLAGAAVLAAGLVAWTGAWRYMAAVVGPGWWLMPVFMILVMALVMALMMMPMMSRNHGGMEPYVATLQNPLEVAARRYATGEISREEYLRIKKDLGGGGA